MRTSPRVLLVLFAALVALAPALTPTATAAVPGTVAGQSTYVPLSPVRVLDTATGLGGHPGSFGVGEAFDLVLPQLPPGATAAVLNLTADRPDQNTIVRVYPTPADGTFVPTVSNLNVPQGLTLADLVVSKVAVVNGNAQVRIRNGVGVVRLVADLAGYYVGGSSGAGFTGTAPRRLLDTRITHSPFQGGESRALDVKTTADGGPSGVPAGATAVVLNVTVIQPQTYTVVRVYPEGGAFPTVSNLNVVAGATVPNLAVVALSPDGQVRIHNSAGATNFAVDLAGWFTPGSGDVFHPVDPYRALDTRTSSSPVQGGTERALQLAGAGAVPWHASSLQLTVTAVAPTTSSYITAHPVDGNPRPVASNLNTTPGRDVPNAVVVRGGRDGQVGLYNFSGLVHLVVDVAGWFGPPGDGYDISWPQCTNPYRTGTTSRHPFDGAWAVIGVTNGRPYTKNACLASEWSWANSLPGGAAGYMLLDSPGQADATHRWGAQRSPRACDGTTTADCGYDYGWWAADYAVTAGLPTPREGGQPQLWLDVEGPYSSGPAWQADKSVNAVVVQGAIDRLRSQGIRTGVYSRISDWTNITGGLVVPNLQQWVFPGSSSDSAATRCVPSQTFTSGYVVLSQYQLSSDSPVYDRNHAC